MWNLEVCNLEVNTALTGHRRDVIIQIVMVYSRASTFTLVDALTQPADMQA